MLTGRQQQVNLTYTYSLTIPSSLISITLMIYMQLITALKFNARIDLEKTQQLLIAEWEKHILNNLYSSFVITHCLQTGLNLKIQVIHMSI